MTELPQVQERQHEDWSEPLTPDDQEALKQRILELKKLLDQEEGRREKYKIEVVFDKRKTTRSHFPGHVMVLRSASALNGDGDESLYYCPNPEKCHGYIPPEHMSTFLGHAVCPVCHYKAALDELTDTAFYRLTPDNWAYVLSREFYRCGCNASFYLKWGRQDLRAQSLSELNRPQHGHALKQARADREVVIYQLYRVLQDISTGASLEKQLKALITG